MNELLLYNNTPNPGLAAFKYWYCHVHVFTTACIDLPIQPCFEFRNLSDVVNGRWELVQAMGVENSHSVLRQCTSSSTAVSREGRDYTRRPTTLKSSLVQSTGQTLSLSSPRIILGQWLVLSFLVSKLCCQSVSLIIRPKWAMRCLCGKRLWFIVS
jgi:hypothetical protein